MTVEKKLTGMFWAVTETIKYQKEQKNEDVCEWAKMSREHFHTEKIRYPGTLPVLSLPCNDLQIIESVNYNSQPVKCFHRESDGITGPSFFTDV